MKNLYLVLIPLFALALLVGCSNEEAATPPVPRAAPAFGGEMLSGMQTVILHTSRGDITLALNADAAPKTVTNFVALAKAGYFDGLTFHRVVPDFVIQGGDPNGNGTGGESVFGSTFEDEINAKSYGLDTKKLKDLFAGQQLPAELLEQTAMEYYVSQGYVYNESLQSLPLQRGAIAMANRGPNTNGSQFFVVVRDSLPQLEGKHTVFGQVTEGMDTVDDIANVERDQYNAPLDPVTFTVEVVE